MEAAEEEMRRIREEMLRSLKENGEAALQEEPEESESEDEITGVEEEEEDEDERRDMQILADLMAQDPNDLTFQDLLRVSPDLVLWEAKTKNPTITKLLERQEVVLEILDRAYNEGVNFSGELVDGDLDRLETEYRGERLASELLAVEPSIRGLFLDRRVEDILKNLFGLYTRPQPGRPWPPPAHMNSVLVHYVNRLQYRVTAYLTTNEDPGVLFGSLIHSVEDPSVYPLLQALLWYVSPMRDIGAFCMSSQTPDQKTAGPMPVEANDLDRAGRFSEWFSRAHVPELLLQKFAEARTEDALENLRELLGYQYAIAVRHYQSLYKLPCSLVTLTDTAKVLAPIRAFLAAEDAHALGHGLHFLSEMLKWEDLIKVPPRKLVTEPSASAPWTELPSMAVPFLAELPSLVAPIQSLLRSLDGQQCGHDRLRYLGFQCRCVLLAVTHASHAHAALDALHGAHVWEDALRLLLEQFPQNSFLSNIVQRYFVFLYGAKDPLVLPHKVAVARDSGLLALLAAAVRRTVQRRETHRIDYEYVAGLVAIVSAVVDAADSAPELAEVLSASQDYVETIAPFVLARKAAGADRSGLFVNPRSRGRGRGGRGGAPGRGAPASGRGRGAPSSPAAAASGPQFIDTTD